MSSEFRALDALLNDYPPLLRKRTPFWHPEAPTIAKECRIPAWNWDRAGMEQVTDRVLLDANGAFMAPLSGTELAHGPLEHTGADAGTYKPSPGYYRIEAHTWEDRRLCSPLGTAPIPPTARRRTPLVWVTAGTVDLLHKLSMAGHWPEITVHDSWTARDDERCRLKDWAAYISQERAAALRSGNRVRYQAVKDGYSIAIQMMLGPAEGNDAKAKIRRPDWYHAIRAQHSANMWRKAWACAVDHGVPILAMGNVDEIEVAADDYAALLELAERPKPPIRFDQTGMALGAFKVKA